MCSLQKAKSNVAAEMCESQLMIAFQNSTGNSSGPQALPSFNARLAAGTGSGICIGSARAASPLQTARPTIIRSRPGGGRASCAAGGRSAASGAAAAAAELRLQAGRPCRRASPKGLPILLHHFTARGGAVYPRPAMLPKAPTSRGRSGQGACSAPV